MDECCLRGDGEGGGWGAGRGRRERVTSFVGAVVAGVGVGVVKEEGAEDGASEDEVVVV